MSLRNLTLLIAILYLVGGFSRVYTHFDGISSGLLEDYPIAIAVLILNGLLYLGGYLMFSNFKLAKPILVTAALVSLCISGVWLIYDAYVGFGNIFEVLTTLLPISLFFVGIVVFYIRDVLKHDRTAL